MDLKKELEEYVDRCNKATSLERELKRTKELIEEIGEVLRKEMLETGIRNMALANGQTIYLRSDLKAHAGTGVDKVELIDKLKELEFSECVYETYSVAKLKSWIREEIDRRAEEGEKLVDPSEALPDELQKLLAAYFEVKLCITASKEVSNV